MSKQPAYDALFFSRTKDFLDVFLGKQQNSSPHTVRSYRISLTGFFTYLTEIKEIDPMRFRFEDCTYDLVLAYSQYLQETKGLAPSSVSQRLAALKSYLKYVADSDIALMQVYIAVNKVPSPRIPKRQRPILEKDMLKSFLDLPEDSKCGNRDRVILILLFDTGIRAGELLSLTLGDVLLDVKYPSILIHGKGIKERSISIGNKTAEHLRTYMRHYHTIDAPGNTPLFYTVIHGKMNHMSERNLERIVKKYGDQLREKHPEVPESIYPHMMRRTRASGMYRDGVPIEMVAAILGHSSTETTRIYAIPSTEQLREAMEKGQVEEDSTERLWEGKSAEIRKMFGLD